MKTNRKEAIIYTRLDDILEDYKICELAMILLCYYEELPDIERDG
jgi:hypothetical protein